MNVTFDKTGNLEGRITVVLEKSDYDPQVVKELKEIGNTRQIPGFRKGHIDMAQLRKRFGKDVKLKVLNDMAADATLKYIEENKLDLLGQPIPAKDHNFNLDDETVTFCYQIGMAPKLDMKFDQSVELPFYNIAVSEEMLKEQDEALRQQAGVQEPGQEYAPRALVKGSIMQLNEDGTIKEGEDAIQVTDGILAPFLFKSKEQADKFEGTKVGDKVVFNAFETCDGNEAELSSMLHIKREDIEKARGNFEITITEFMLHKPAELGQEFYDKVFGADTVHNEEEYMDKLKENIQKALEPNSRQLFVRTAEDYLMNKYGDMELPEDFLRYFMLMTDRKLTEESAADALKAALPGIKWEIIESQAASTLNVKVTEEDLKAFARIFAIQQLQQYGMGQMADQMADYYAENMLKDEKQRRRLAQEAFTGKLFNAIHNSIKLDEKTVSLDQFRTMVAELNAKTQPEQEVEQAEE